jgi:DNA-binding XRE family transcriptional regulator
MKIALGSLRAAKVAAVRSAPDDLSAEFKLYRNMNALCDTVNSLTEATHAFGPNNDYEALAKQSQVFSSVRRNLGESLEQRTAATQQELNQARIQIKTQQEQLAAAAKAPPKEIVVAETEPPKKPAPKKKATAKKPVSANTGSNPVPSTPNSNGQPPPATTPPKS